MINRRDEIEIDLLQVCKELIKSLPIILLAAVILAAAAFGWAVMGDDSAVSYKAEASLFLAREAGEGEETAPVYLTSDYAKAVVENGVYALTTPYCLEAIAADSGLGYDASEIKAMLKASQIETLSAIKVEVTSAVAGEAEVIANSVVKVLPDSLAKVTGDDTISVSEYSVSPEIESDSGGKNPVKMALIGAVVGAFIAAVIITLKMVFSEPVIYKVTQLHELYPELPVLADVTAGDKQFSYAAANLINMVSGKKEGFALAYTAVKNGRLGALELASAVAGFGRKVLLVDGELYGRQLSEKTALADNAGLKDLLAGDAELSSVVNSYENVWLVSAGNATENNAALLADKKLDKLVERMKVGYDYVIFNLPAVGEVADALPAVKLMDGVILGLEENKCTVKESDNCVEQLLRTGTKILGFVVS